MDYGEAQRYLLFQHDEHTKKPVLDENGELIQERNITLTVSTVIPSLLIWNVKS